MAKYDFFICHASEDKVDVVAPLAGELRSRGYRVWYDDFVITAGDSLSEEIDRGLARSRYGIVVLSPDFFKKRWPRRELTGLVSRETSRGKKVIIPVWHKVAARFVERRSPTLADRKGVLTEN